MEIGSGDSPGIWNCRSFWPGTTRHLHFCAGLAICVGNACVWRARTKKGKAAVCQHPDMARPAMEAAGIDVFATARAAGLPIEVVRSTDSPQDYYCLVLVD